MGPKFCIGAPIPNETRQEKFEQVLMEWVIACDQPFEEVERPEFVVMMNYTHHTGTPLKIPKRNGIKRRLMKMGDD